jgi:peptidoglycan hydrolase-like protein with peptidoglycan-binding domain
MSLRVAIVTIASCVFFLGAGAAQGQAQTQSGSASLKQAQTTLKQHGYYKGSVDGINGPQTRAALQRYQQEHDLKATGRLDAATSASLEGHSAGAVRTDERNAVSSDKPQDAVKEAETSGKQGASDTSSAAKGAGSESKSAMKEAETSVKKEASEAGSATKGAVGAVKGATGGDSSKKKDTTK